MASRILVIDDKRSIVDFFRSFLEAEGYDVEVSTFALENVVDIERMAPALVILDFLVGDAQEQVGWQLLQKLKMHQATASIPILVCTPRADGIRQYEDYLQQKNIPIMFKPFSVSDLLQQVRLMLSPPSLSLG